MIDDLNFNNTGTYHCLADLNYSNKTILIGIFTLVVHSYQFDYVVELGLDDFILECNESYLVSLLGKSNELTPVWLFNYENIHRTNKSKINVKKSGNYLCQLNDTVTNRKWFTNLVRVKVKLKVNRYLRDVFLKSKTLIVFSFIIMNVFSILVSKLIEHADSKYTKLTKTFITDFSLKNISQIENSKTFLELISESFKKLVYYCKKLNK